MTERKYETETMIKLYLDDKHVGYEWHVDGLILHSDIRQPPDLSDKTVFSDITIYEPGSWYGCPGGCESSYIQHDSFDIGIEINGDWLFTGDEVETRDGEMSLFYDSKRYRWFLVLGQDKIKEAYDIDDYF